MYYYLLSKFYHIDENAQKNDPNYPHAKKNISIFMLGSVAYLFTAGFLWSNIYSSFIDSVLFLSIIKNYFMWFILVDIVTCCILFKQFWGWGILSEVDGAFSSKNKPNINNIRMNNTHDIANITNKLTINDAKKDL
jgi:hypothetical protein